MNNIFGMTRLIKNSIFTSLFMSVSIANAQEKPNVIIIYSDDQGAIDLNIYGSNDLVTPNIDNLAKNGVRFTQFYAAPVCSPSRASLLTGLTPQQARVPGNAGASINSKAGLPTDKYTMAEMFKEAGYKTAHIGKWHLGYQEEMRPNAQGFDYSFGHLVGCIDNYSHFFYWNGPNRHDLFRNGEEVFYPGEYFPDLMLKEAGQFMEQNKDNPFFVYFAINMPHYPYQGDPKWLEYYKDKGVPYPRDLYAAFVSTLDDKIGKLLDKISDLGIRENTIIVFQSDNGYSTEERAHFGGGSAGIYRGAKGCLFEGGIRVPAIISWPGKIPSGEVRNQMAVCADWMPTLADMCGINLNRKELAGKSMMHVIYDYSAPSAHNDIFCWKFNKMWAARKGNWKLLGNPIDTQKKGILTEKDSLFLVDLTNDPGEMINISAKYPNIVKELKMQYEEWLIINEGL